MFARQVSMKLKPESREAFARTLEAEIIPLLRKQKGFKDEISFVNPDGRSAIAISLWDSQASAHSYSQGRYADVSKILSTLIEGALWVKTFEVANSTAHSIAAKPKAA